MRVSYAKSSLPWRHKLAKRFVGFRAMMPMRHFANDRFNVLLAGPKFWCIHPLDGSKFLFGRRRCHVTPRCAATSGMTSNPVEADVVVVGAGIIGLTIASKILYTYPSISVAILDRVSPSNSGTGTGPATGAGQGYLWMIHRDPTSPAWELALRSIELWKDILEAKARSDTTRNAITQASMEYETTGSMLLATEPEETHKLQERCQILREAGINASFLEAASLTGIEPELTVPRVGGALLVPSDSQINGRAAANAILETCRAFERNSNRFHALLYEGCQDLLTDQSGHVIGVATQSRIITARMGVVMACGAWTGDFLARTLSKPEWSNAFRPRKGHLIEVHPPSSATVLPRLRHGLMEVRYTNHYSGARNVSPSESVDVTFTATTAANGALLVGSSREFSGWDTAVHGEVVDAILSRAATFLPFLGHTKADQLRVRVGLRPFSPSGPVVGPVPGVKGLYVAAGHEGSGLTLAPVTAEILAADIFGNRFESLSEAALASIRPRI